jgi:hypothetical protein
MDRWRLATPKREKFGLAQAREPVLQLCSNAVSAISALPLLPLQHLGQGLATEVVPILARKLADGEIYLLLAGTRFAESYTQDLHLCDTRTRILRLTAHLARSRLRHHLPQENPFYETY